MKHSSALIGLTLAAVALWSQDYAPLLKTTAWYERHFTWGFGADTFWYCADGDTTISSTTYTKIRQSNNAVLHLLREDTTNRKVYGMRRYLQPYGDSTERLIYDFSLSVGEKVPNQNPHPSMATLMVIDTIQTNAGPRRRFEFQDDLYQSSFWVVEGVGSITDLFHVYTWPTFEALFTLFCSYEGAQRVYEDSFHDCAPNPKVTGIAGANGLELQIWPNPASNTFIVSFPHRQHIQDGFDLTLTSVMGHQVIQHFQTGGVHQQIDIEDLPKGLYIVTVSRGHHIWRGSLAKQ